MTTSSSSHQLHPQGGQSSYGVAALICVATFLLLHAVRMMNDLINNVSEEPFPLGRSSFNFMDCYSMDSRFATLSGQYRHIASMDGFDIYERQTVEFSLTSYSR